jgi:hypothetical protein
MKNTATKTSAEKYGQKAGYALGLLLGTVLVITTWVTIVYLCILALKALGVSV